MAEELQIIYWKWVLKRTTCILRLITLERVEILRDLRLGVYDVIVGINFSGKVWTFLKSAL
jgi:excinuclease UvrABC helicase subunit UvrB